MPLNLKSSKILVVDDEALNVILLEQILDGEGYTNVQSTTDPRVVADLHREHAFDLILLDIRMPHMTGIDVMNALTALGQDAWLPVLVLTAQTDDETRENALAAGARDFINKPFKQWEALQRIHNILETRLLYNQQKNRAADLEDLVRQRTREVEDTQLKVIERLGRAGEYRDNETGAHVLRMSRACHLLALEIGLSPRHADLILYASPMHDVGKIGIPDQILLKPGRLTPEERQTIETHTDIGADIIGDHPSEVLRLARIIAQTHHEKWDGSGYPKGLKGEEIPVESRIAAVCDVFDALTSPRPYKKAWTTEDAVSLLIAESGKHFDPDMVTTFVGMLPKILALREQFPDPEEHGANQMALT